MILSRTRPYIMKLTISLVVAALLAIVTDASAQEKKVLRIGHFPNITHVQALVASNLKRQGKGWFEERIPGVEVQWFVYNAGPSAMEAIFANSIDLTYVGPSPVLNAYARSKGDEIRVLAGAARGGAALVVPGDGRIAKPADLKGLKLATPQLGNTQDIAARAWLKKQGFRITQIGGDVLVVPTSNPDQLNLFQKKDIAAVWTVEPWVSRLELEADGKIMVEQKEEVVTVLASSAKFLKEQPDLAKRVVAAHVELTKWIADHPDEAKAMVRAELKELTKRDLPEQLADRAWPRLTFSSEIAKADFDAMVAEGQSVGFLKSVPALDRLIVVLP